MGKNNKISSILVLIVILTIVISTFMVVSYFTGILSAAVSFASSDQIGRLHSCGIYPPPELTKLQTDLPTLLIPGIYAGLPGLMVFVSILMFIAGYYYGGGKDESSSETTTTTSRPKWNSESGKYESGTRLEETRTQRTTRRE